MSRKVGIIISLMLALLFTFLIVFFSNIRYNRAMETVTVATTAEFIPAGSRIEKSMLKTAEVPKSVAKTLATVQEAVNKTAKVSLVKGQYIYKESLDKAAPLKKNTVEVFVPVDLSSSAMAVPGQYVNVYKTNKDGTATLLLEKVLVLHSLTSQGSSANNGSSKGLGVTDNKPSSVGLEVPVESAGKLVSAASEKTVYLVRCSSQYSSGANSAQTNSSPSPEKEGE